MTQDTCTRILWNLNLTVSIDDAILEKARKLAVQRGTSVQELIRAHLEALVGETNGSAVAEELLELMQVAGGRSGGRKIRRDEAYEGRT